MALLVDETAAPEAEAPRRRRDWRSLLDPRYVTLAVAALVVAYLALVPIGTMVYASLRTNFLGLSPGTWTFHNYVNTFTSDGFGTLVVNSFVYAGATAIVCTVIGFLLAWLVARTNTPGKGFARVAALVPLIVPGILNTVAWSLLLSPRRGTANAGLRHLGLPAFNVFSLHGMIFVQSMHVVRTYLMGVASFASMDSSLEEASLASGASPLTTFRAITLRMARPAMLSAGLLMFIQTISTFEVPQLIGVPGRRFVFVSRIYSALQSFPPDYGTVGSIGIFVLVIAAVGLWLPRGCRRPRPCRPSPARDSAPAGRTSASGGGPASRSSCCSSSSRGAADPHADLVVAAAWLRAAVGGRPAPADVLQLRADLPAPGLVNSVKNSLITAVTAG
jgi:ABC-type Fe3+ transport system, permease component